MSAPVLTWLGSCADQHGPVVTVHDLDGSHMGFAVAMLRALFDNEPRAAVLFAETVPEEELLRSAIELALSLTMSGIPAGQEAERRATATRRLESAAARYETVGQDRRALLCRDLATVLTCAGPSVSESTLHYVEVHEIVVVCSMLMLAIQQTLGISTAEQIATYGQILAMSAARQSV